MGCAVEEAVTVREAVGQIGRGRPDVIVCNPVAPDREGFDLVTWLLTWLKADPKTQSIPILYLLAPDTPPELTSTLRAGPADDPTGPFNPAALQKRVREKLGEDEPAPVSQAEKAAKPRTRRTRDQESTNSRARGTWLLTLVTSILALAIPFILYLLPRRPVCTWRLRSTRSSRLPCCSTPSSPPSRAFSPGAESRRRRLPAGREVELPSSCKLSR